MSTITQTERQALEAKIYSALMSTVMWTSEGEAIEPGMGEMGETTDEANRIVSEWMQENNIIEI